MTREHYQALKLDGQIRGDYVFHEEIGYGGFSIVHRCTQMTTGRIYAVKVLWTKQYTNPRDADDVKNEVALLKRLRNTGGPFIDIIDDFQEGDYWYIVTRFADKGDLDRSLVRHFEEYDVADIMLDVFTGLNTLHNVLGIAHRDMKPENIFLRTRGPTGTTALIGDFGLSEPINQERPGASFKYWAGTPWYWAPEVFRTPYGPAADIWATGLIMWRMLIGNYPIPGVTDRPNTAKDAIYRKNVKGLPENWLEKLEDEAVYLSQAAWDFLQGILHIDPIRRMTAEQALAHEFLVDARAARDKDYPPQSPTLSSASSVDSSAESPLQSAVRASAPSPSSSTAPSVGSPRVSSHFTPCNREVDEDYDVEDEEEEEKEENEYVFEHEEKVEEEEEKQVPFHAPVTPATISPTTIAAQALLILSELPKAIVSSPRRVASPERVIIDLTTPVRDDRTAVRKRKRTQRKVTPKVHHTRAVAAKETGVMVPAATVPPAVVVPSAAVVVPSAPKGKKMVKENTAPKGKKAVPSIPEMQEKSARQLRAERRANREVIVAPRKGKGRVTKR